MKIRKLIALFTAAAAAVTTMLCGTVSASAATSAFDLMKDLKKHPVTEGSTIDSSISYNWSWESNALNFIVSGLSSEKSEELLALTKEGQVLSISFGTDTGFYMVHEDTIHLVNFKQSGLDAEYHYPDMSVVYFTKSGANHKLVFRIEFDKFYSLVAPIKTMVSESKTAAFSLSAVDKSSGKRTYYGGKKYRYLQFAAEKTEKVDVSTLTVRTSKSKVYSGGKVQTDVSIYNGKYKLRKGVDYTLSYKNNVNIGTATVIIKGMGVYTGTKKTYFRIIPKTTEFRDPEMNGNKVSLSWKAVTGIDYYFLYRSSDGGKTYTQIKSFKAGTVKYEETIPQFTGYIYRIRTGKEAGGKMYYSKYSDPTRNLQNL